jgi:VanZ family protein
MKLLIWVIAEIILVFLILTSPIDISNQTSHWFDSLPIDKIIHIVLFGSLALSIFAYFQYSNILGLKTIRAKALALIFCILYGIGMEYYQKYFVPSRSLDVIDMLADAMGALLALPFFNMVKHYIQPKLKSI